MAKKDRHLFGCLGGVGLGLLGIGLTFLILHWLGISNPFRWAIHTRGSQHLIKNIIYLVLIVIVILIYAGVALLLLVVSAYRKSAALVELHVKTAKAVIERVGSLSDGSIEQSWENIPRSQKEFFITTYLRDRYGNRVAKKISPDDGELIAKAYWFKLQEDKKTTDTT